MTTNDDRTTITATDGRAVTLPVKYGRTLAQTAIDTLVFDAHNAHPVSAAVVRAMRIEVVR